MQIYYYKSQLFELCPLNGLLQKELSVLAFSFFAAIFSSLLWLIYSLAYIGDNTVGVKFSSLGMTDISVYTALVIFPIIVIWAVFGYINQYLNMRNLNKNLFQLFKQMKKNQDYTDLIARIMLESEQQIKDGFILNRIDILIADMNELIAELISRASLASFEQIENLWGKVRNGGKWALGKVIIEVSQSQPNFEMRIFEKSQRDLVLAGTILEFCARYQNILSLLEKHDKERVFLNVIETGVFGKVYSVLAPLADEIRRHRETSFSSNRDNQISSFEQNKAYSPAPASYRPQQEERKNPILSGISKLGSLLKKEKQFSRSEVAAAAERDPFSIALERSFGSNDEPELQAVTEPKFEFSAPAEEEPHFDEPRLSAPYEEETPEIFADKGADDLTKNEIAIGRPEEETTIPPLIINRGEEDNFPAETNEEPEELTVTSTQRTLNDLRKEWEDMRKASQENASATQEEKNENFTYPFGGWTDESNYHK